MNLPTSSTNSPDPAPTRIAVNGCTQRLLHSSVHSQRWRPRHAEMFLQGGATVVGGAQCPRPRCPPDPAALDEGVEQSGSERAGDVVALLGPVDAAPDAVRRGHGDPEPGQGGSAGRCEQVGGVIGEAAARARDVETRFRDEVPLVAQGVGQGDAEPSGDVVVAAAGQPHRVRAGAVAQRPDGLWRREPGDLLEQPSDLVARQPVVATAALRGDLQQSGRAQVLEVGAGRRGADPGLGGEHARGQGAAVVERHQHAGATAVGQGGTDDREVGVAHASNVGARCFGGGRIVGRVRT
ncbi:hypothetical protein [Pseudonocardia sp. SCN 73-27]|uniref:hypothetical protein n=1 Tax=unclassified Pseudonocardia TaxID=2619320 RepID=UPI0026BFA9F9